MVHRTHSHLHRRTNALSTKRGRRDEQQERQLRLQEGKIRPITVQVQILTGRRIPLVVDAVNDTVLDIKEKIRIKEGIHPDLQLLLYNGLVLPVYTTARELQLHDQSLMFMSIRNRGG